MILSPAAARFKVPVTFILPVIVITLVPLTARSPSNVKLPVVSKVRVLLTDRFSVYEVPLANTSLPVPSPITAL